MENDTIIQILKQVEITDKGVHTLIKKVDFYIVIILFSLVSFVIGLLLGKLL